MPIIHFINSKTQTVGGMKNVLAYVTRTEKTKSEDKQYVTTLNCFASTAYNEMLATKNAYHKNSGRMYYHLVQSFPKGDDTSPELAHRIAVEFAEKAFKGHECVVAPHIDAEHIHSHIVFNAVNADSGRKYHSNKFTLNDIRNLSDEMCRKYGVQTLEKPVVNQRTGGITTGEYRSAMKGESWKIDLINTIDEVMKQAKTQKQFCFLMRQRGYGVRWEESRKYITYTCPNGKRCRDNRLHDQRYSKEMMCNEFKIRADEIGFEIQSGRSDEHTAGDLCSRQQLESSDSSAYVTHSSSRTGQRESKSDYDCGADELSLGKSAGNIQSSEIRVQTHSANNSGADNQFPDELNQPIGEAIITGWKTERGILLQAEIARRMEAQNAIENAQSDCDFTVGAFDLVAGIADVVAIIDEPTEDDDIERHSDSKVLAEEIRRKEALGMHMG